MNAEDNKKLFERIRSQNAADKRDASWEKRWLVSKVEELEAMREQAENAVDYLNGCVAEVEAKLAKQKSVNKELRKDLLHSGRMFARQRDLRKESEAELTKAKGQRDRLFSCTQRASLLPEDYAKNKDNHVCNPGCWMCRARAVLRQALAELEKE